MTPPPGRARRARPGGPTRGRSSFSPCLPFGWCRLVHAVEVALESIYMSRRLFQAKLSARREQRQRFADAPLASLRSLGDMDPDNEVATLPWRQLLKKGPRIRIRFDCRSDVARQLGNVWLRRVSVLARRRGQAGWRQQPRGVQLRPAPTIDVGPFARGFARRDLDCEAVVVDAFDQAVDPAEAERFANEVLVRQRFHARVGLVNYEPNSATRFLVLCEPRVPFRARSDVEER